MPAAVFALATLIPLPLLLLGAWAGGPLAYAGLIYLSAFALLLDQLALWPETAEGREFPGADALLVVLGLLHLLALPLAVRVIAGPSALGMAERVALFAGFGLFFGQVAIPVAHELIHRGERGLFRLGRLIYVTLLFGHHTSAHRLVHHRHAASREDPNSAREGEGYYRFALRAWVGSFRKGLAAENALRAKAAKGLHPYALYCGGALACLVLGWGLAGAAGVLVWAGLAAHAQSQLLLSDYVQHYGLLRGTGPDGRLEPVGDRHSWNAPQWFTSALMLNAPRHSDHHAHPSRPYASLRLPGADVAPRLPWSLPVSCSIALIPPVWRRMMRPRLAAWRRAGLVQPSLAQPSLAQP